MSDLPRDGERSLTQQLVDLIAAAIERGELDPGEKLPPTRALAELAGVNHLTAVRAYRRLRELGLVTAQVGRGTYVRGAGGGSAPARVADSISWQRYALPPSDESYGDRVLAEMHRQATTQGLVPFSVGYPSDRLFPTEEIWAAIAHVFEEYGGRALQYSDVQGTPELAFELARLSDSRGAAEDPDDILITNGAAQALSLACHAILRPGDLAACEDPSFTSVIRAISDSGAEVVGVPMDEDGLDVDALEALLSRREIRLLALQPRLQNPTGRDLSPQRRGRLLDLARRHGFFILEDGVYGDLRFHGDELPSLRSEAPAHVVYVDSLSKTISGGMRIGWVAASGPVLDRIAAAKRADDIHSPTPTQLTMARYLGTGAYPAQAERARAFYRERLDALRESIDRHLGSIATYREPLGGGHLWVDLDLDLDERELADEAVRQGVAYVPGNALRIDPRPEVKMRLSFGYLEPDQIDEGLRRLATAIEALRGRPARRQAVPV
ncbi:MAG: PLP-dependent aminotransferase family protein [Solirubrobacterales bacterium]